MTFSITDTPRIIRIVDDTKVVWEGTPEVFGLLLAAMRGDLVRSWMCVPANEEGQGPCWSAEVRDEFLASQSLEHKDCGEIVYFRSDSEAVTI